jgi:hypothetical protein
MGDSYCPVGETVLRGVSVVSSDAAETATMRSAIANDVGPACTTVSCSSARSAMALRIDAVTVGVVVRLISKPRPRTLS